MSAFSQPLVVRPGQPATPLKRISLNSGGEGAFSEAWLQNALFENPACLPIRDIDPHIGDLIPVCMELETGVGPADILYVTPTGQVVLVETKLWRNPEARRQVVAQILDYAKELTQWSFDDLAREAGRASKAGPSHLLDCFLRTTPNLNSNPERVSAFVDGINASLASGDVLLLIAGDGIRSGAESLIGFLERYGNLQFSFGLVEVAAYQLPDDGILLQPRILAKTEILKRTIVVGATGPIEFERLAAEEDAPAQAALRGEGLSAFWTDFLSTLQLDDPQQPLPTNVPRGTNIFFAMPPAGTSAWVSAYLAQSRGIAGAYLSFAKNFADSDRIYEHLLAEREQIEAAAGIEFTWERREDGKIYIGTPDAHYQTLEDEAERRRVIEHIAQMTNVLVSAFRHRLEVVARGTVSAV